MDQPKTMSVTVRSKHHTTTLTIALPPAGVELKFMTAPPEGGAAAVLDDCIALLACHSFTMMRIVLSVVVLARRAEEAMLAWNVENMVVTKGGWFYGCLVSCS